ncbi:pyridoxamine 5'-phosphate oxidase family protein [Georgenia ruanii]|uniref:Pyridoxamine 5'-phosphate oxidase family protein n=1 Tax=Georgenia ruanii TaxID=348442 RepID=A0A7J9UZI1_9MICO|nr:pyridoxamine 5'-phosphate oxidase family protein [Georgenia ruanii]MPV89290.1 pyridoxamine 5'-phosphate oxidase family protein [Georgenia ruanii]
MDTQPYGEVLDRGESLRLVRSVPVGWLTFCAGEEPQAVPVNFALDGDELVIRSGYGAKLAAAARGAVVALAVSALDTAARTGWSVVVRGPVRLVEDTDPDAGAWLAEPSPWAPGEKEFAVVLRAAEVSGRRLRRPGTGA